MKCAVHNCTNVILNKNKKSQHNQQLSFFGFPKCPKAQRQWLAFCRNKEALKLKSPIVCSEHFKDEDIQGTRQYEMGLCKKRTLRTGAVPCINKNDENAWERSHKETTQKQENKKLVAELLAEAEALSNAPLQAEPTLNYVRHTTGLASAPDFVSTVGEIEFDEGIKEEDNDPLTMEIEAVEQLEKCRTCFQTLLNDDNNRDLCDQENKVFLYHIEVLTGVWINCEDGLPHHMCPACVEDLRRAIDFRENCIRTEGKLKQATTTEEQADITDMKAEFENLLYEESIQQMSSSPEDHLAKEFLTDSEDLNIVIEEDAEQVGEAVEEPNPNSLALGNEIFKNFLNEKTKPVSTKTAKQSKPEGNIKTNKRPKLTNKEKSRRRRELIRSKPPSFVCDQCGLVFRLACNLQIHMLRHSRTKNYQCSECPMTFYDAYTRNMHLRVRHKGENPYTCKYCDESFNYSYKRHNHERDVHGASPRIVINRLNSQPKTSRDEAAPRHFCHLCDKSYISKYALGHHMNTHTGARPFKCNMCDKTFAEPSKAKRHQMTHEQRPWQCDVCLKRFFARQKLQEHSLIHTGERPHWCELCDIHFRYKHNLSMHRNSKTHLENLRKAEGKDHSEECN